MPRPNVVLLLTDGHGWDSLGRARRPDIKTPNMDALAAHGVRFTQTICQSPIARASRATVLSGQYPNSHGLLQHNASLPKGITLISQMLSVRGYTTGCTGLLDLRGETGPCGFEVLRAVQAPKPPSDLHSLAPTDFLQAIGAVPSDAETGDHPTDLTGSNALRFVQSAREPFFLCMSFAAPAPPFNLPAKWSRAYDPSAITLPSRRNRFPGGDHVARRMLAAYYGAISHVDHQIGRLMATLAGRGFTNNIFIYCSTRGDSIGRPDRIQPGDGLLYDGTLRVPLIIAGMPGQQRGITSQCLAELTDVVPTVLDLVGIDIPASVRGNSLRPHLQTGKGPSRTDAFAQGQNSERVLRNPKYKLIETKDPGARAFYDLNRNPGETANIFGKAETRVVQGKMASTLHKLVLRLARRNAGLPSDSKG